MRTCCGTCKTLERIYKTNRKIELTTWYNYGAAPPCGNRDGASTERGLALTMQSHDTRVCRLCGKSFVPRADYIRAGGGLYCSRACYRSRGQNWQERVFERIEVTESCWLWKTAKDGHYGYTPVRSAPTRMAHRAVYELVVGPIPDGFHLDHLCRNPRCVNPDHLEPVTCAVNILRGVGATAVNKRKTSCPKGHLYSEENTYVTPQGYRQCRQCVSERRRRSNAKRQQDLIRESLLGEAAG